MHLPHAPRIHSLELALHCDQPIQMIKFFQKIRQKLLAENRLSKYLLYAIGEILLVVIGILLALQINNWNTHKQETKELQNHLKNIQNNLQADRISIEEIRNFRDSSVAYSQNYLKVAKKDEITIDDFNALENSNYKVYFDSYFKPRTSGFETLKNSGFIGKLSGTKIEMMLNEYYYIVDKIIEREQSLNHTIETLENIAHSENIPLRMFEIHNNIKNKKEYFSTHQEEIKELLNHPSIKGANFRNRGVGPLVQYYRQGEQLAHDLIKEIDIIIESQN